MSIYSNKGKSLSRDRLIELLQQLPAGDRVICNSLGNLSVLRGECYAGFIDFAHDGAAELVEERDQL